MSDLASAQRRMHAATVNLRQKQIRFHETEALVYRKALAQMQGNRVVDNVTTSDREQYAKALAEAELEYAAAAEVIDVFSHINPDSHETYEDLASEQATDVRGAEGY